MVALEHQPPDHEAAPAPAVTADAIPLRLRRTGVSPRQVLAMTLVGLVVLAIFAAPDLPSWTERLGDGPIAESIQRLAAGWNQEMTALGITRPHEALRQAIARLLDWQWGSLP